MRITSLEDIIIITLLCLVFYVVYKISSYSIRIRRKTKNTGAPDNAHIDEQAIQQSIRETQESKEAYQNYKNNRGELQ